VYETDARIERDAESSAPFIVPIAPVR